VQENGRKEKDFVRPYGYFDLSAYRQYNDGTMTDFIPTDEDLKKVLPPFFGSNKISFPAQNIQYRLICLPKSNR
jgi:hypothetical protein